MGKKLSIEKLLFILMVSTCLYVWIVSTIR
jgi:hypothetical protein